MGYLVSQMGSCSRYVQLGEGLRQTQDALKTLCLLAVLETPGVLLEKLVELVGESLGLSAYLY